MIEMNDYLEIVGFSNIIRATKVICTAFCIVNILSQYKYIYI